MRSIPNGFGGGNAPPKLPNTAENNGGSADAPSRWQRPPPPAPMVGSDRGLFEECWAGLVDSEGHSGERKGMVTMGGGGAVFLLGSHGGVELDLADNFGQDHRNFFYLVAS